MIEEDGIRWTKVSWNKVDIFVENARLYSTGRNSYSDAASVSIYHKGTNRVMTNPDPGLEQAIKIWWCSFKETIPLEEYLQGVFGSEV